MLAHFICFGASAGCAYHFSQTFINYAYKKDIFVRKCHEKLPPKTTSSQLQSPKTIANRIKQFNGSVKKNNICRIFKLRSLFQSSSNHMICQSSDLIADKLFQIISFPAPCIIV